MFILLASLYVYSITIDLKCGIIAFGQEKRAGRDKEPKEAKKIPSAIYWIIISGYIG